VSHSKGFLSGTCPGNYRKRGRPREVHGTMLQQYTCGKCGKVKDKRVRRCLFGHRFENKGQPDHGYQKQKCSRCGHGNAARVTGCGFFRQCNWHNCSRIPGLHCKRCASGRG
jgi:hypothetical protein